MFYCNTYVHGYGSKSRSYPLGRRTINMVLVELVSFTSIYVYTAGYLGTWYLARDTPIRIHFFPFFLFFILFTNIFALSFFSLPPINSRNSDPGGSHSRLFSLLPTIRSCLACSSRADFSSSLVDLGRTVCLPTL